MKAYIYVASSWRNPRHPTVVDALRACGHGVYDFKRDEGAQFHWSEAGVTSSGCTLAEFDQGLNHPRARAGFASDFGAMARADAFVLVLPCGRSAHLELGWAVGRGKPTAILVDNEENVLPELMYSMVDCITGNIAFLIHWLSQQRGCQPEGISDNSTSAKRATRSGVR